MEGVCGMDIDGGMVRRRKENKLGLRGKIEMRKSHRNIYTYRKPAN